MLTNYPLKNLLFTTITMLLVASTPTSTDAASVVIGAESPSDRAFEGDATTTGLIFVSSPGHAAMGSGGVRGFKSEWKPLAKSVAHKQEKSAGDGVSDENETQAPGMARQLLRWAAESASVNEAAYVHSLTARAELFVNPTSGTSQTSDQGIEKEFHTISELLTELKIIVPAWETVERQHIDLILKALHQWEVVTETQMYRSEANVEVSYLKVRAATRMLESRLPNTLAAGTSHELWQSLIYRPLAASVRSLVWIGSVYGQVSMPIFWGSLLGLFVSNWETTLSLVGLSGLVGLLIVMMQALAIAMFRCSGYWTGCAMSLANAYIIMCVVRWCLTSRPTSPDTSEIVAMGYRPISKVAL